MAIITIPAVGTFTSPSWQQAVRVKRGQREEREGHRERERKELGERTRERKELRKRDEERERKIE